MAGEERPALPYAGSSGWSGSDTSRERALEADTSGVTAARQRNTVAYLHGVGSYGATWSDIAAALNVHHGSASGVLSVLHKAGKIMRLRQTRDRCKIYVLPDYVNGRDTEPHGRRARDD